MLKTFAAAALLGSFSTFAALPDASQPAISSFIAKTDRIKTHIRSKVRNYVSPRIDGNRVAFCSLTDLTDCGKGPADAFCRINNFEQAINFERDRVHKHSARRNFRQIKCEQNSDTATAVGEIVIFQLPGKPFTVAVQDTKAKSLASHENVSSAVRTRENLTVLTKNLKFPLKGQMTVEPCSSTACFDI